jgi:polyribonucleotide nucleotidyltransferase
MSVPVHLHRQIIGPSGTTVKKLIEEFGGPEKVNIQFPKSTGSMSSSSDVITIKAHVGLVPKIRAGIDRILNDFLSIGPTSAATQSLAFSKLADSSIEVLVTVPNRDMGRIAGKGGDGLNEFMRKYSVGLWVLDDDGSEQPDTVRISIRGHDQAQVDQAKQAIQSKIRQTHNIALPIWLVSKFRDAADDSVKTLNLIMDEISRKARMDHGVAVDWNKTTIASGNLVIHGNNKQLPNATSYIQNRLAALVNSFLFRHFE